MPRGLETTTILDLGTVILQVVLIPSFLFHLDKHFIMIVFAKANHPTKDHSIHKSPPTIKVALGTMLEAKLV